VRRNFTRNQKEQIVERARRDGVVHCDGCGLALKPGTYDVDHIIPEGNRPAVDKLKPLTLADGQVLGNACCHRGEAGKTNKDIKAIAKGKRQYDGANGLKRVKASIPSRPKEHRPARDRLPMLVRTHDIFGRPISKEAI
jgi:hypothetical protein